ncbi:MAG: LPS export ABC transporter permease LptF [Gammaproteobacteria bacterium]
MIIVRYLYKEIAATMCASTGLLLLIFMSTQFVHFLSMAAGGIFAVRILLHLMALQIPTLLALLLPVGFYMSVLLAYGRLYADREMVVLQGSGLSQARLIKFTLGFAAIVCLITFILNLWVSPLITIKQRILFAEAKAAPLIETIAPARFFATNDNKTVFYVESISRDRQQMQHIFVADRDDPDNTNVWSVITANKGFQYVNRQGEHFIVIANGKRYQGLPGESNFQVDEFKRYYFRLSSAPPNVKLDEATMSTWKLFHQFKSNANAIAEFQWRVSMPLSVIILALLAIPLSHTNPRQGRYAQLLPAIGIYIVYANLMFLTRSWIQSKVIPGWLGAWWLHLLALTLAFVLLARQGRWWQLYKMGRLKVKV